ncbi:MAG: hypothetical protein Q8O68_00770 [Candidatus Daviesbacteria bacterium]|nr:hypothetical protein [Candidatus Daviesbacteria bacterium]
MRIAFLQDLCPSCSEGGGQLNDQKMIEGGIRRGHNIKIITPGNKDVRSIDCDLMIISNCVKFPKEYLSEICEKYPYIFFHHDFEFYDFRLHYPMEKDNHANCNRDFWLPIFQGAKLHVWLSPLHREGYLTAFPELGNFKNVTVPSALNVDLWKPVDGVERVKDTVIGVNCLELFKGRYNIHKYAESHPELQFTFVGNAPGINLPNCKYLPYTKNEELPKLYSAHEYFVHLPSTTEPFGRISAEAILCGCKVITNGNNGAFSHEFMKDKDLVQLRKNLKQAPDVFWEEIELAVWGVDPFKNTPENYFKINKKGVS